MQGFDKLRALGADLWHPAALAQLGVVLGCLGLAWALLRWLRPAARRPGILFGQGIVDGVLFPVLALGLVLLARWGMQGQAWSVAVFRVVVPLLLSLAVIRVTVQVLHTAFPASRLVRALERTVSWMVWALLVGWLTGVLPLLLDEMAAIKWRIAGASVSLRDLAEGALSAVAVMLAALWLSAVIEARLMAAEGVHLSLRKIGANAVRAGLLLVGLLVALTAAGIPLGALGVLGGALGVGIGLGLQKLAANYVSGFVILAERSLRIGDVVRVDNFEGRVVDIKSRYTVIRSVTGRESIVPNELLITQRVENSSFADPKVALTSSVQVAYGTDLPALMPQLCAAMATVPRVLADPSPAVQLAAFGADGLELTLVFWVGDPENGQGNVRSEVNLAVLKALATAGAEIPYPQRVLHTARPDGPLGPPQAA